MVLYSLIKFQVSTIFLQDLQQGKDHFINPYVFLVALRHDYFKPDDFWHLVLNVFPKDNKSASISDV